MGKFRSAAAVFIGAASFGILSTFVKKAYALDFTLAEVTGVQVLFGMLFLWSIFLVRSVLPKSTKQYEKKTAKWKILLAGVSTGVVSILYYKSVELVPASIAIVLLMQFIWISAIIEMLFFKQRPTQRQAIGMLFILAATLLATGVFESAIQSINWMGVLYGLLAATAYAVFIIVNGRVGNDYPPVQKSALMVSGAGILIFTVLQPFHLISLDVDLRIYQFGLLLSVFGTVLPPLLYAYGMPTVGTSLGSILSAVELPVAVAMSFFVLHEPVTALQWIGVFVILAMVAWINLKPKDIGEIMG